MKTIKIPTEKQLEIFIKEEEKIRMSKEYQDNCTAVKDIPNGWLQVTAKMQEDLVVQYGFDDEISKDIAVNRLRTARYRYPNNPIFQSPVYVRENKARIGTFKEGDKYIDLTLKDLSNSRVKLSSLLKQNKKNLIFASSHT